MTPYYTLLARTGNEPWRVEFGDYDIHVVEDEKQDLEHTSEDGLKIIKTDDGQTAIEAGVAEENTKLENAQ